MDTHKLKALRRQLYTQYFASWFFNRAYDPGHGPIPSWRDVEKLLIYDLRKRKNPYAPLPQMHTLGGKNLLTRLLEAYDDARPVCDKTYKKSLMKAFGWECPCGRTNPNYTSTCVCGKNKRELKETP